MGIGFGIFLMVVGAVLRFGITAELTGIDLETIGVILMLAGAAVIVLTLGIMATRSGGRGSRRPPSDSDVL